MRHEQEAAGDRNGVLGEGDGEVGPMPVGYQAVAQFVSGESAGDTTQSAQDGSDENGLMRRREDGGGGKSAGYDAGAEAECSGAVWGERQLVRDELAEGQQGEDDGGGG